MGGFLPEFLATSSRPEFWTPLAARDFLDGVVAEFLCIVYFLILFFFFFFRAFFCFTNRRRWFISRKIRAGDRRVHVYVLKIGVYIHIYIFIQGRRDRRNGNSC